jgi:hypothetical protein
MNAFLDRVRCLFLGHDIASTTKFVRPGPGEVQGHVFRFPYCRRCGVEFGEGDGG